MSALIAVYLPPAASHRIFLYDQTLQPTRISNHTDRQDDRPRSALPPSHPRRRLPPLPPPHPQAHPRHPVDRRGHRLHPRRHPVLQRRQQQGRQSHTLGPRLCCRRPRHDQHSRLLAPQDPRRHSVRPDGPTLCPHDGTRGGRIREAQSHHRGNHRNVHPSPRRHNRRRLPLPRRVLCHTPPMQPGHRSSRSSLPQGHDLHLLRAGPRHHRALL
jgi:hypothetical protein